MRWANLTRHKTKGYRERRSPYLTTLDREKESVTNIPKNFHVRSWDTIPY